MRTMDALFPKRIGHDSAPGCRRAKHFLALVLLCGAVASLVGACASFEGTRSNSAPTSMMSSCPGPMAYRSPDCEPD